MGREVEYIEGERREGKKEEKRKEGKEESMKRRKTDYSNARRSINDSSSTCMLIKSPKGFVIQVIQPHYD
jgi:hypothetical protein